MPSPPWPKMAISLPGSLKSGIGPKPKKAFAAHALQLGGDGQRRRRRVDLGDRVEQRLQRLRARRLDRLVVHAGAVEVADAGAVGTSRPGVGGGVLEHLPDDVAVVLADDREALGPACLVGGELGLVEPAAAGVAVEVLTRIGSAIHRREQLVEAGDVALGLRRSSRGRCGVRLRRGGRFGRGEREGGERERTAARKVHVSTHPFS